MLLASLVAALDLYYANLCCQPIGTLFLFLLFFGRVKRQRRLAKFAFKYLPACNVFVVLTTILHNLWIDDPEFFIFKDWKDNVMSQSSVLVATLFVYKMSNEGFEVMRQFYSPRDIDLHLGKILMTCVALSPSLCFLPSEVFGCLSHYSYQRCGLLIECNYIVIIYVCVTIISFGTFGVTYAHEKDHSCFGKMTSVGAISCLRR